MAHLLRDYCNAYNDDRNSNGSKLYYIIQTILKLHANIILKGDIIYYSVNNYGLCNNLEFHTDDTGVTAISDFLKIYARKKRLKLNKINNVYKIYGYLDNNVLNIYLLTSSFSIYIQDSIYIDLNGCNVDEREPCKYLLNSLTIVRYLSGNKCTDVVTLYNICAWLGKDFIYKMKLIYSIIYNELYCSHRHCSDKYMDKSCFSTVYNSYHRYGSYYNIKQIHRCNKKNCIYSGVFNEEFLCEDVEHYRLVNEYNSLGRKNVSICTYAKHQCSIGRYSLNILKYY